MIPCHDALLSLWNYKPHLPSRSCLAHGVLSEIRKVANTPAYRLSSMENKKMNILSANHNAWSIFPFPAIGEERRTHIHQCFKVVGRCIGPGVLSREDLRVFQWMPTPERAHKTFWVNHKQAGLTYLSSLVSTQLLGKPSVCRDTTLHLLPRSRQRLRNAREKLGHLRPETFLATQARKTNSISRSHVGMTELTLKCCPLTITCIHTCNKLRLWSWSCCYCCWCCCCCWWW